ncbi:hypothetical protein ABIE13_000305 [Ottowia thiooxydans]|uniref:Uncharacterized protein n=1 Tax=Ottowia thiooxydans TaxID=219182 RepID=A0ABV2Q2Z1_9BURK
MRPAAQPPSFGPPKEPGARKGGPTVRVPALRYGQPPVLVPKAVRQNSRRSLRSLCSDSCRKLVHEARASCSALARLGHCAPRHVQRGGTPTRAIASLGPRITSRWRDDPVPSSPRRRESRVNRHGIPRSLRLPGNCVKPISHARCWPRNRPRGSSCQYPVLLARKSTPRTALRMRTSANWDIEAGPRVPISHL